MCLTVSLIILVIFEFVRCVPPSPTDRLQDDVAQIRTQLEKLNIVYLTQLEPRLMSTNTRLTNVDSNVKNLQERAHVWDTFQLHVTAWNDQLSSLDRKIDIISKGQENLLEADAKFNAITSLEYKLETILKKLEANEEKLEKLNKKITDQTIKTDPLFGEFATRGILSTLKHIQKKVDRIDLNRQTTKLKQTDEEKHRRTIKCSPSPILEELLTDVSSKVDIIFDKLGNNKEHERETEDYLTTTTTYYQEGSGEAPENLKVNSDVELLQKVLKRIKHPCKQTNKLLEQIHQRVSGVEDNTSALFNKGLNSSTESCRDSSELQNVTYMLQYLIKSEADKEAVLYSLFQEQHQHFESSLKTQLTKFCTQYPPVVKTETKQENVTKINVEERNFSYTANVASCEDLRVGNGSGIYLLERAQNVSSYGGKYNVRYCEERPKGFWTVIQRRGHFEVQENFTQPWSGYKYGFGSLSRDFWFGNEFIHMLTKERYLTLRIELEDFEGHSAWAEYTPFQVLSENENYKLLVGGYNGNASDSLTSHNGSAFSTFDVKNDDAPPCCPCALSYGGGWWFNSCFESNLNGVYHNNPSTNEYFRGLIWEHWLGNYSLKKTLMLVRMAQTTSNDTSDTKNTSTTTDISTIPFFEDP